jgi:cathepsin H
VDLPSHVDWREKGVVSEVKNQGHCGSCWTFSTVGCLEAHLALKYDAWRAPRLSEQQLVECAQDFDNHGCEGGLPSHAFEYVRGAGGLSTEFSYPYLGVDGKCRFNKSATPETAPFRPSSAGVGVEVPGGSVNISQGDEAALKYFLATRGPVSVAFQVASDFRHYESGVYTSTVCKSGPKDVNHAVLAVGYGTDPVSGLEYWTIKNSWDYSFGMEGFFKIEAMKNMCGVADCAAFPDLYGLNAMQRTVQAVVV